ncbi:uncharacterized protein LOC108873614 [Lates calcarifer]|uniref:Uncharacterized protein LOC108873614 n=1 Tax=Lates calcarifer TaxID=8187 RepID=A0AAJ7L9D5_LATCA|nr:uncharacterized protein LOC108873614 [Lates calcarifer]
MDIQIAKTTQSLTTAAEMRETTKMLMKPNANWEEYLTPAPLSIAIMAELVFISRCDDFSINKNPPKDGFKFIKYPESFRACLMQVCNSGWHAFNEAHKNMDQIRIHTSTVPDYMKAAVNILFNGTDEVIENLLPNQLENIRTIADECVTLADSVEKKYADVINLIQELLEACINAEHFYGEELERVKMKLEETKLREQSARQLNDRSKKVMEDMSKQVEEAQNTYKKAMDSLPSGWEMIGMDFVESVSSALTVFINGCAAYASARYFNVPFGSSKLFSQATTNQNICDETEDEITQMKAYSKSAEILKLAASLKQHVSDSEIDWKNLYDQKNKSMKTAWTEEQFKRISEELQKMPNDNMCKIALSLCERGITICEELATYTPDQTWDEKKTKQLIKDIQELNDGALTFDTKSKAASGTPALTPKPPMMFKADNSSGGKSAGQRASEDARFRIEQSQAQLKHVRQSYEKCVENMEKNQKELTDILVEMQNCKINEIDFDTKIKMLVKGLDAMGRVKEQWEKMVLFFQMVSNIVKTSLSKTMHNFVKTSEDTKKLSYNGKLFAKDLLYNQAFQASNIASLVHVISETYTEVSNKYLMDRVSSLGKLMAMDKEKPEFLQERLNLQESCQEAQRGILQLVLKNKKEFEIKTDARMKKIEGELKAILPAAPPEETERIKEIVQDGFSKDEEESYY